jgi:hypothetical protein
LSAARRLAWASQFLPSDSGSRPRLIGFVLLVAVLFGYGGYALFLRPHGVPDTSGGGRTFLAGEIAAERSVAQTMRLEANGLHRIGVKPASYAETATGDVHFRLWDVTEEDALVIRKDVHPAAHVLTGSTYRWEFEPVMDSAGRRFRLEVSAPATAAGQGIGLVASYEDLYPDGALFIADREQWGDLVFSTAATRATVFRTLEDLMRDKPAPLHSRWFLLGVLLLYGWALAAFIYYMGFAREEEL